MKKNKNRNKSSKQNNIIKNIKISADIATVGAAGYFVFDKSRKYISIVSNKRKILQKIAKLKNSISNIQLIKPTLNYDQRLKKSKSIFRIEKAIIHAEGIKVKDLFKKRSKLGKKVGGGNFGDTFVNQYKKSLQQREILKRFETKNIIKAITAKVGERNYINFEKSARLSYFKQTGDFRREYSALNALDPSTPNRSHNMLQIKAKLARQNVLLRTKAIGVGVLKAGATAALIYGATKYGRKIKEKISKVLLSRQEKNKRISIGLRKSARFKNRKMKKR